MSVTTPGRRPAFPPIGRLRASSLSGGKKNMFVALNLTAMVDMFTILVIFLIQLFTASGQVTLTDRIVVPKSVAGELLEDPGTVVLVSQEILLVDGASIPAEEMGTELDIPIPGLVKVLKAQREFRESIEGRDPNQPYDGLLIIQADVKTDFRTIRRILTSGNEAGWAKFKFVTIPGAVPGAAPAEGAAG